MSKSKLLLLCLSALIFVLNACKKDTELIPNNATNTNNVVDQTAVTNNVCGAVSLTDASMKARMLAMEPGVQAYISKKSGSARLAALVTVPVVFHVIYNTSDQNISDAQLQSQVTALNSAFSASNADISNVPACFQPLIGNPNIQFTLAARDPNGNATNGIIRKATTVTSFSSDGSVCYSSLGGDDAWSDGQYLNIWVCNKSGAAGYSAYPWSGSPGTDGIIIGYNYVGTTGTFTNNWSYLLGRTLVHEVGHWFGLIHIWGDAVCGDDLVGDTPCAGSANGSCPTFPHMSTCSPNSNGDMFMNYMDYTYDACRVMFSAGQAVRMQAYLNTTRASLLTSLGGVPPGGSTCNIPSGLSATNITTSSASLNWASTGAGSYNVQYKSSAATTWTTISTSSTSVAISGLAASTTYNYQVQSVCSSGYSAYCIASSFTTAAVAVCNIPSGLTSSSVTASSATLSWSSTGAASYNVQYKASTSSTWTSLSTTASSISVSGLLASTAYSFQVQSVCSSSSSSAYSGAVGFTTLTPACNIPSGLSVSSITTSGAILTWASSGASSYIVIYKPNSSSTWTSVSTSGTSVSVSGLTASTGYSFEVQSVCSGSNSGYSAAYSFTTAAAATCNIPTGLTVSNIKTTSANLSWYSTGASSYITHYRVYNTTNWNVGSTTSSSMSLPFLKARTTYEVQVESVCSGGTSSTYSSSYLFTTK